ncbi:MAG: calcium:sodium antiporter, partial [Myxococcota bacterium]|nr:calcium:sodium antiporter [Myxococcota bacterium]
DAAEATATTPPRSRGRLAALTTIGLVVLVIGGHLLVAGAVGIARVAGLSDRIIGLTIVAIGTSLPELATALIAAVRGHGDIAIGNVVGSNIFNVLLILGASGLAGSIDASLRSVAFDVGTLGVMTLFAALAMVIRRKITRVDGTILLLGYVLFLTLLALQ